MSDEHEIGCWAMPRCLACGKTKKPVGRSAPLPMANGLCDSECPGYHMPPTPGHFWPDEEPELRAKVEAQGKQGPKSPAN